MLYAHALSNKLTSIVTARTSLAEGAKGAVSVQRITNRQVRVQGCTERSGAMTVEHITELNGIWTKKSLVARPVDDAPLFADNVKHEVVRATAPVSRPCSPRRALGPPPSPEIQSTELVPCSATVLPWQ